MKCPKCGSENLIPSEYNEKISVCIECDYAFYEAEVCGECPIREGCDIAPQSEVCIHALQDEIKRLHETRL